MRTKVMEAVAVALAAEAADAELPRFTVEVPPDEKFGDFSTNVAMVSAKLLKSSPKKIADTLLQHLSTNPLFEKIEIAGPGFINFFIHKKFWQESLTAIPQDSSDYGSGKADADEKVMVEFVSANPTGPLHIGHGRGAAVGDALVRLLRKAGKTVVAEYYINDAGRQMDNLGRSTYVRYMQLLGEQMDFPDDGYHGDYINDIASDIEREHGSIYLGKGDAALPFFKKETAGRILDGIKNDLKKFNVHFDVWTSEQTFHDAGKVEQALSDLHKKGSLYEQDDALWLKTDVAGDEKDRVVKRANGIVTYLAADIAYHADKYDRGFTKIIDVWGADHHGYVKRMKAVAMALNQEADSLHPILIQLVNLKRGGEVVAMSTRSGEFTTLVDVLDEVGADAARFFFLTRSYDSHLDFDMDLAKEQSSENPVYYVQYAHARICNIFKMAEERGIKLSDSPDFSLLSEGDELRIMKKMNSFPYLIADSAASLQPHPITHYLTDIAGMFHKYYSQHRIVTDDAALSAARLAFVAKIRTVIKNGLDVIGVSSPERM